MTTGTKIKETKTARRDAIKALFEYGTCDCVHCVTSARETRGMIRECNSQIKILEKG